MSTFHGLEMAKRSLSAQQSALYTTSHNIANANTEGYTRQRVNFEQLSSVGSSRDPGGVKDQVGSGVQAGSIGRIRDRFLDTQYRKENSKLGFYQTEATALRQMENLLNEPTEVGLAFVLEDFDNSLQDLNVNSDHSGTRTVVAERGEAVVETFQYLASSLEDVRDDLKNQLDITVGDVNTYLNQLDRINQEIARVEPHGLVPNDLYDERDRLIDELSTFIDLDVKYNPSSGNPKPSAEGVVTISLRNGSDRIVLVGGPTPSASQLDLIADENNNIISFTITNEAADESTTIVATDLISNGSIKGLVEMIGYVESDGEIGGYYNAVLADLELMLVTYADQFNAVHKAGFDLDGDQGMDFFTFDLNDPLGTIAVNEEIKRNTDLIAASSNGDSGDGSNAIDLASVYDQVGLGLGTRTSVKSFYQSLIGGLGVKAKEANRMADSSGILTQQVEGNRQSVNAVSLDEEISNLIKYQHAYNAVARSMTAVDEMLDRIINQMGLVGR